MFIAAYNALVLASELNLTKISQHFGIAKKFKWEEALLLGPAHLKGIVQELPDKLVYIFHFGGIVFINFQHHEINDFIRYLHTIEKNINMVSPFAYQDDYRMVIDPTGSPSISNEQLVTTVQNDYQLGIVALVLAKSVSLEKIEFQIDGISDQIEDVIGRLQSGQLTVNDTKLAHLAGDILAVKHHTLSYLMLLDRPDITWVNEDAGRLFDELSTLFELDDRYQNVQHKTDAMMDITEVFASLTHAKRGNRLEWMVIILIAAEIVLSLISMFVFQH